jgi:hypothetical protein
MSSSACASYYSSTSKIILDLFTPMGQFSSKDDLTGLLTHKSNSSRLAPWIELDSERLNLEPLHALFEDHSEGIAAQYCRLP